MSLIIYLIVNFFQPSSYLWSVLIAVTVYYFTRRSFIQLRLLRSLPPGPFGLPFLGYLPFLKRPNDFKGEMTDLSRHYGSCFSIRLGSELLVFLSDQHLIREAFRQPVFDARPHNAFFNIMKGYGVVNAEGKLWKKQRQFLRKRIPQFRSGMDRAQSETRIMREAKEMLDYIKKQKSEPFLLDRYLSSSVSNVISSSLMSIRFGPDEPRFLRFTALFEEGFRLFTVVAAAAFLPAVRLLPKLSRAFKRLCKNHDEILHFAQEVVEKHKVALDPKGSSKDIVDAYIQESREMHNGNGDGHLFAGMDPDRQIHQIIADLFSAGTETIQTTLRWATLFALREPELQDRVQRELDTVVGRHRLPSLEDMANLPFTEAFLLEVMRRATVVPLGTSHVASKDTTLSGMTIPKGAQLIPLLHAVHMNPSLWIDPERFNPERFLSDDQKRVIKPDHFIPFGAGRRACPGDSLAMASSFLFLSSLLQNFQIRLPEGVTFPPELIGTCGATFTPKLFWICAIPREIVSEDFE